MEWLGWIVAVVLAIVIAWLYSRRGSVDTLASYAKDRYGMAFVIDYKGGPKIIGGPTNHVGHPSKHVIWKIINASTTNVTVDLTVKKSAPGGPADPFSAGSKSVPVPPYAGNPTLMDLTVKDASQFAVGENPYQYSLDLQGIQNSGLDPELDIWR